MGNKIRENALDSGSLNSICAKFTLPNESLGRLVVYGRESRYFVKKLFQ
jgi:hypothetical protein